MARPSPERAMISFRLSHTWTQERLTKKEHAESPGVERRIIFYMDDGGLQVGSIFDNLHGPSRLVLAIEESRLCHRAMLLGGVPGVVRWGRVRAGFAGGSSSFVITVQGCQCNVSVLAPVIWPLRSHLDSSSTVEQGCEGGRDARPSTAKGGKRSLL